MFLHRQKDNQHPAKQEELIQCLFGTQAYTGDFHFTSFTEVLLRHYLERAGFKTVKIELLHDWLFDAVGEKIKHFDAPPARDFSELKDIRDDQEFLLTCYREILQRDPDDGGMSFFLSSLKNGGMGRQNVIDIMLGSPEYAAIRRSD